MEQLEDLMEQHLKELKGRVVDSKRRVADQSIVASIIEAEMWEFEKKLSQWKNETREKQ